MRIFQKFSNVWSIKNFHFLFFFTNAWKIITQVLKAFAFFIECFAELFR